MAAATSRAVCTRLQIGSTLSQFQNEAQAATLRPSMTQHCFTASRKMPNRNRGRCKGAMQQTSVLNFDNFSKILQSPITFPSMHGGCNFSKSAEARGRRDLRTHATKKGSPEVAQEEEDWDPDFVEAMNELCNKAVRVMLSEDLQQVEQLRTELDETGATLVEHGEIDAARFVLVVQEMLEHKLAPERKLLKGRFNQAFEKIFGMVEDAGWSLQTPEEAAENAEEYEGDDDIELEDDPPSQQANEPYNRTFQAHDQFV